MGKPVVTVCQNRMRLLILLGFLLAAAPALASPVRDDTLDQYIRDILDLLKTLMPTGIPDVGIPPLDPFEVPHFDIPHIEEDLIIRNLSTFDTTLAHLDLENLSLELGLSIAELRGDAVYNLTGLVLGILPLYGDGAIWLELYQVQLHAQAAVLITEGGFAQLTSFDISADFSDIKLHLDNLLGGGAFGESVNNLLQALGGYIWDQLKVFLFPLLDQVLLEIFNDLLSQCSIADLIESGSCFQERIREMNITAHYIAKKCFE